MTAERPTATKPLLVAEGLTVLHGQLTALRDVSIAVHAGAVFAVVGANGAGKSTLLRTLAGLHRAASGTVRVDDVDITQQLTDQRVRQGVVLVPEGRRLFPSMTIEENLLVGAANGRRGEWTLDRVYDLFPWMRDRQRDKTSHLSGGEQQGVAIGRAPTRSKPQSPPCTPSRPMPRARTGAKSPRCTSDCAHCTPHPSWP